MSLREAAQMALDALEEVITVNGYVFGAPVRAVESLRAALADQSEQTLGIVAETNCYGDGNVYRGQRSKDSQTPTITFSKVKTVEPVAFIHKDCATKMREVMTPADFGGDRSEFFQYCMSDINMIPLYTAPPQRKPLTDDEIKILYDALPKKYTLAMFARAIERAHGIGGEE